MKTITDFTRNGAIKSAIRTFAHPIPDADAFDAIIQSILTNNPFGCISYMNAGANHPPVEITKETYTAKFVYLDDNSRRRGTTSESYDTLEGYKAGIAAVQSHGANITAHGGVLIRNEPAEDLRGHAQMP